MQPSSDASPAPAPLSKNPPYPLPNPQSAIRNPQSEEDELTEEIYVRLREWRRVTAAASGRPPFDILSDEVLREVAEQQPHSAVELGSVADLTLDEVEWYGDVVVEIVMSAVAAGRIEATSVPYAATGPTPGGTPPFDAKAASNGGTPYPTG